MILTHFLNFIFRKFKYCYLKDLLRILWGRGLQKRSYSDKPSDRFLKLLYPERRTLNWQLKNSPQQPLEMFVGESQRI